MTLIFGMPVFFTQFYCKKCGEYIIHSLVEFTWKTIRGKICKSTLEKPYCPTCHKRLHTRPRTKKFKEKYYK